MTARIPPVLRPTHPVDRSLAALVQEFGLTVHGSLDGAMVSGITLSTKELQPGDLYVGIQGATVHGAAFAKEAALAGAVAIVTDAAGLALTEGSTLPVIIVEAPRLALGALAAWIYHSDEEPPLMFGVTGTNGKTSTVYLLEAILRQLGLVTGLSSTAERHIADLSVVSRLTTPEASELHALLARMREEGVRAVAVEVSAQALSRHRVDGLFFDVVGFTNLSHDHLDDYADMEEYFQAKLPLFAPDRARRGVVSLDSPWGIRVVEGSRIPVTTLTTSHGVDAEWTALVTDQEAERTGFVLSGPEGRTLSTSVPLIGRHMVANAALAIVMLVEAGFELEAIGHALGETGIIAYLPGRTERVSGQHGPKLYVDFGHSPDAFLNTLAALRQFTPGKVIMLFGADGDRDASKRAEMARVAAAGSDILIITDHHPRFEDPAAIRETLYTAARRAYPDREIHNVSPPEEAIREAVALAGEGDTILWAGPGHQDYRDIRGERTPYSARQLAREALRAAGWPPA